MTADANGSFRKRFDIPCRVGDGEHSVTATAATGHEASADVELDGCEEEQDDEPVAQPVIAAPTFTG